MHSPKEIWRGMLVLPWFDLCAKYNGAGAPQTVVVDNLQSIYYVTVKYVPHRISIIRAHPAINNWRKCTAIDDIWDYVTVNLQQAKYHLWTKCYMSRSVVLNPCTVTILEIHSPHVNMLGTSFNKFHSSKWTRLIVNERSVCLLIVHSHELPILPLPEGFACVYSIF